LVSRLRQIATEIETQRRSDGDLMFMLRGVAGRADPALFWTQDFFDMLNQIGLMSEQQRVAFANVCGKAMCQWLECDDHAEEDDYDESPWASARIDLAALSCTLNTLVEESVEAVIRLAPDADALERDQIRRYRHERLRPDH
jgi:hypothetical protein